MGKYRYQLFINDKKMTKTKHEFIYQYSHTKNIKIIVDKNSAYIDLYMGVKKEFSDLSNVKFDVLIDAIKKAYLLHILIFKQGLKINKLRLARNDEEFVYDSSSVQFPYVLSMVEDTKYDFDEEWSNEYMINNILTTTKSKRKEDNRFISLYAYLSAKSKKYSIDKFTNLWMAFNAYYCYNAKQNTEKNISGDRNCINYFLKCVNHGTEIRIQNFRKENKQLYYKAGSELAHVSSDDYKELYDRLYNKQEVEGFEALIEIAGDNDEMTLFGAILCEYAYYMRCNYIHGSRTITLLWTYNEHEVSQFNLLIYFLERFLGEYIPKMFKGE